MKKEVVNKVNFQLKNKKTKKLKKIFNSLEIDMLPDGKLSVSNEGLELLDFALISIHSSFKLSKEKMTDRVLAAFNHPKVKIFAHPTARKLNEREGVELDWEKIFDFCKSKDKWIEINTSPTRLDLPDFMVRDAVKRGVKLTLGTDAHHIDHMDNMKYGVYVARRGWAEKGDIINTRSLKEFERMIE
jgi:DNA polymerase (family 10)